MQHSDWLQFTEPQTVPALLALKPEGQLMRLAPQVATKSDDKRLHSKGDLSQGGGGVPAFAEGEKPALWLRREPLGAGRVGRL